jgi:hypothetical protein
VSREQTVDWVSGACLLLRTAEARAVGFFDERFFMYEEDVDLCASLRARGGRILFTPAAEITHLRGRSVRAAGALASPHYDRSHPRVLRQARTALVSVAAPEPEAARATHPIESARGPFLRIAIDARKLHDYGIGTYVRNLVQGLARQDDDAAYAVLCRDADAGFVQALGSRFTPIVERSGNYSVREQLSVPLALRRARADLFHAPHYVVSPLTPCPYIVTIHDCIHLRFPQYLPNRMAYTYARRMMSLAARRSRRVLTVSNSVEAGHPALPARASRQGGSDLQRARRTARHTANAGRH